MRAETLRLCTDDSTHGSGCFLAIIEQTKKKNSMRLLLGLDEGRNIRGAKIATAIVQFNAE
jgi:hypothetical protein